MFDLWGSGTPCGSRSGSSSAAAAVADLRPLGAFISEQFGTKARYTGASLGYQLATLLGGGFTPTILATLFRNSGGQIYPVAIFLIVMGVISTVAILVIREGRSNDLRTVEH